MALLSDMEKARGMGAAGRKMAEKNFSLEAFAKRTEQAYLMLRK
jgi:glycosyltransferase involved in cell wall biosynthesis